MFASQLSNQLVEAGHQVLLISLLPVTSELPFKGDHIKLARPLTKRFIDWQGWKQLAQEVKTFKPDVVQSNAGDTLKFAVFSKLFFGWKAPIVFRNANKVSDFITTTPKLLFNKFLVSKVRHVISVSELCRLDFIKTYSFDEKKTTTVPIGIEVNPLQAPIAADLQPVFSSGKVLVHVASFVPEKNHAGLLRIIQKLVLRGVNVKAILIGDGKLKQAIQQYVIEFKLQDHVFLLGYRTDVLAIMRHAHAFVLPSLIEGLPGVILEAMYCKIPVVAYDVGGISEVVINNETGLQVEGHFGSRTGLPVEEHFSSKTGWLVKAGNEEGFVKAVEEVLAGDTNAITEHAYTMVVREYDNKVIAKRFVEVYNSIVNRQ
jgi:glycosyltransferase involved in cell wall biosynthesis